MTMCLTSDVRAAIIASGYDVGIRPVSAHGIQIAHAGRLASSQCCQGKDETGFSARY
jgi:hypothetical protein